VECNDDQSTGISLHMNGPYS